MIQAALSRLAAFNPERTFIPLQETQQRRRFTSRSESGNLFQSSDRTLPCRLYLRSLDMLAR